MFVDKSEVIFQAGDGGDGYVSFRQEKFIDKGGPSGGDGGDGGDIILVASRNQNTLAAFRYQKQLLAQSGKAGFNQRKHGKSGSNLLVAVPVGTSFMNSEGVVLADMVLDGQQTVVANGGKGGFGNAHFVSSVRQAPMVAEKGEKGDLINGTLELKMIADVGLIGLPNAGKSTLLASTSNARPEIANYPFTTLIPNLGVVDIDKQNSLLFADIPGLIEGASKGKGLGDEFLRHVERTPVLLHLIDIYTNDLETAYKTIQVELKAYKIDLSKRPQIVALTKIDGLDNDIINDRIAQLKKIVKRGTKIFAISAQSKQGLKELLYSSKEIVSKSRKKEQAKPKPLPVIKLSEDASWLVEKTDNGFRVTGQKIERFAMRTDFGSTHGQQRLRDILKKTGILRELNRKGITAGQKIRIGDHGTLEY